MVEGFVLIPGPFQFTEGLRIQFKRAKKKIVKSHVPELGSSLQELVG